MAISINSLLSMGAGALNASQASIQTTGNNISNVNTKGYSRQAVRLETLPSIDFYPGQMGQGVRATEVFRYFDKFIEHSFLGRNTMQSRFNTQFTMMTAVEGMFNESGGSAGLGTSINSMFGSWNTLAQEPSSSSSREALLQTSNTLAALFRSTNQRLDEIQREVDNLIGTEVQTANRLINEIAQLNKEINIHTIEGRNNANSLMDARDQKVRELSDILDVNVQDNGAGHYMVSTKSGQMLVQEGISFSLQFGGRHVDTALAHNSKFDGTVEFSGSDGYEYTIEVVKPGFADDTGKVPPPQGTASYRVSLDGGRTWMKDENGNIKEFTATDAKNSTAVKDLQISFTGNSQLTKGDTFTLSPKNDVYWITPTAGPINISTQVFGDGTDNHNRITGGTLAGYLAFRDNQIGTIKDKLDETAKTIIWEVNRLHSQGTGLEKLSSAFGTQVINRLDVPLGSPSSDLPWADRLQPGNISFAIYDASSGEPVIGYPGIEAFTPENFDPSKHTLADVVAAINSVTGGTPPAAVFNANIVDGKLNIELKEPGKYTFGIANDTTGLAAALGINTFFKGTGAGDISIRDELSSNPNLINAGAINGAGEGNSGDNAIAKAMAELSTKTIAIKSSFGITDQSISEFYGSLVSKVGSETSKVKFAYISEATMTSELSDRQAEVSGVNLDEEMSNLIKFQASYKAAAKLITTADQMLQTLLSLKQ